jgi:hypothetical protein
VDANGELLADKSALFLILGGESYVVVLGRGVHRQGSLPAVETSIRLIAERLGRKPYILLGLLKLAEHWSG